MVSIFLLIAIYSLFLFTLMGLFVKYIDTKYLFGITVRSLKSLKEKSDEAEEIKKKLLENTEAICSLKREKLEEEFSKKFKDLSEKAEELNNTELALNRLSDHLKRKTEVVTKLQTDLENIKKDKIKSLERISDLSAEEAKNQIIVELEHEVKFNASINMRKIIDEANATAQKEAKEIVISAMQRIAAEQSVEISSSSVSLEDNQQKGIIIGKDGRNIRSLELLTGVDIIIDETPNVILLSSFDPMRREIAKQSIEMLLKDGRVHPSKIEEIVSKVEKNLEFEVLDVGRNVLLDLGIYNVSNKITRLIGKMKYRSSYSQNLLQHSIEVANLCAVMAGELGLDIQKAKRAGLMHDMGKVSTDAPSLTHAILGMKIAEQEGECAEVCNAIGAHHDEIKMTYMLSPIIQICDAVSGARPGARRDITQQYLKRMHELEKLALSQNGVRNCFAVQSGKELRVLVDADIVSDSDCENIAFQITRQIEKNLQFPGQIKVVVIREKRYTDIAKL